MRQWVTADWPLNSEALHPDMKLSAHALLSTCVKPYSFAETQTLRRGIGLWRRPSGLKTSSSGMLQVVKPAARPAPVDASLGLDVVVRWHREWDAQALDVLPQPREHVQPH